MEKVAKKGRNTAKIEKEINDVSIIDKETYKLDVKNYHAVRTVKTQIIVGGSLRKDSNHILHLQMKDFGHTKKWPTYTITREGQIYEHFNPTYYSDYFGNKDIDRKAISIELENMGLLTYDPDKNRFVNWILEECHNDNIFNKEWKNARYWEKYSNEQYNSLAQLSIQLCNEHDIKLDSIGNNVFNDHAASFEGIIVKSNLDTDYFDLNPSFDFKKFMKLANISVE